MVAALLFVRRDRGRESGMPSRRGDGAVPVAPGAGTLQSPEAACLPPQRSARHGPTPPGFRILASHGVLRKDFLHQEAWSAPPYISRSFLSFVFTAHNQVWGDLCLLRSRESPQFDWRLFQNRDLVQFCSLCVCPLVSGLKVEGWVGGWVDRRTDGWVDTRMDGWTGGRMDGYVEGGEMDG